MAALLTHPGPRGEIAWLGGSLLLITLLVGSTPARGALAAAPWRWLGRVSYSLYLVHVPILLAVVHAGWGHLPLWTLLASGIALALVSAHWMQRWVEHPCELLGRRLADRIGADAAARRGASALPQ